MMHLRGVVCWPIVDPTLQDFVEPWRHLPSRDCDRFALVWESACLKELGSAVGMFIAQQALQQVSLGELPSRMMISGQQTCW
jgi:hypothetical protein